MKAILVYQWFFVSYDSTCTEFPLLFPNCWMLILYLGIGYRMLLYGTLEVDIMIMCACAPAHHTLLRRCFKRLQNKRRLWTEHFDNENCIRRFRHQTAYELEEPIPQTKVDEADCSYEWE